MEDIVFLIRGSRAGEPFSVEMYQGGEHPFFTLRWQEDEGKLHIRIVPKMENEYGEPVPGLVLDSVSITFPWKCSMEGDPEYIFMNGYQSWTDSHEHVLMDKEHTLPGIVRSLAKKHHLERYGDYDFTEQAKVAGEFHGFTYCYFRQGDNYRLLGSLSERSGFTVFYYNANDGQMIIEKDCAGLEITKEWQAFDLLEKAGSEDEVFDAYFAEMDIDAPGKLSDLVGTRSEDQVQVTGYTSWYNHYQNISSRIILDNLKAAKDTGQDWDIFQIDDGFQTHVGDWLSIDQQKFPKGLRPMSDAIHEAGMKAGLWLAPFACETASDIFQKHQDWLLKDEMGQPICCGDNWGGFYALDLENEAVRDYLRDVFDHVLNQWDFDLVKLDFLYVACLCPTRGKTRGQLMCEAMDFLRELVGDKLILGCGVPLGPAFGKVDFCRIGCDVGLNWDGAFWEKAIHRERVSTKNAIGNAIYRRQLDGRAFWNDPDVYLLRDDNISLSLENKKLLAQVNGLFGSLIFTSDDVSKYDEEKQKFCEDIRKLKSVPRSVRKENGRTVISYQIGNEKKKLQVKL